MAKYLIAHRRLLDVVRYDKDTGEFFWKEDQGESRMAGARAEHDGFQGYLNVWIDAQDYRAHRLAWFYVTGEWPSGEIDHKNGARSDNRFENLRDVTRSFNQQNRRSPQRNNRSGFLGVTVTRNGKFKATVRTGEQSHHAGTHDTPEQAYEAYVLKKRTLHPGCTL